MTCPPGEVSGACIDCDACDPKLSAYNHVATAWSSWTRKSRTGFHVHSTGISLGKFWVLRRLRLVRVVWNSGLCVPKFPCNAEGSENTRTAVADVHFTLLDFKLAIGNLRAALGHAGPIVLGLAALFLVAFLHVSNDSAISGDNKN